MGKKNFFSLFSKKDGEKLNNVKILSFNVTGYDVNPLYFWKLPKCEMKFVAKDGKVYTMHSLFSEFSMSLSIGIAEFDKNSTFLYGDFKSVTADGVDFFLDRIFVNSKYRKLGLGTAMMEFMLNILLTFVEENNILLHRIHGVIGTNGDDTPEISMELYRSFNEKPFGNNKIVLNPNGFNTIDCNLEYYIV